MDNYWLVVWAILAFSFGYIVGFTIGKLIVKPRNNDMDPNYDPPSAALNPPRNNDDNS